MITYCTNIHPGEGWAETFLNLRSHLPAVKAAVSPGEPFPVGLRLSHRAAMELDEPASAGFADWLRRNGCFVPTINGFPYGSFHSSGVKEKVYLPDWRRQERAGYTARLATLLDSWLPEGVRGSISTVPVGFGKGFGDEAMGVVRWNLLSVLEHLDRLRQKSGKEIILSLEPEAGCLLEATGEVIGFFDRMDFPDPLASCIGVCLDCCHQAVQFENPAETLAQLDGAGIRLGKVQISSALRMKDPDLAMLEKYCEPCYLHQVVVRNGAGVLRRYNDLPEALEADTGEGGEEWRVHFHVPIFAEGTGSFGTTRFFIEEALPLLERDVLLEVETYTWDVLPAELRSDSVTTSIVREIRWLKDTLAGKGVYKSPNLTPTPTLPRQGGGRFF